MILVTGASGFIGRALKNKLATSGHGVIEVNSHDGGVANKEIINNLPANDITHVFHLAGKTFIPESWQKPHGFYSLNVNGTLNILELCRIRGIPLTYISSYLYGIPERIPISEDAPVKPNNPYAHSKFLAEQLCLFYMREFGVVANIIRPFNVYGIGQDKKFLIPHIIDQALHKKAIRLKDLKPKRDYVHVLDLVDALICAMENKEKASIYNIGSGSSISVQGIVNIVLEILGIQKPVVSEDVTRKDEIDNIVADITKAKRDFNWQPKFLLYDGIKQVVEFERVHQYE